MSRSLLLTISRSEDKELKGHTDPVLSVAFSPNGKRVVSASKDGKVKVWDTVKGTEILSLKGHTSEVNSVSFSPDGNRIVCASHDGIVKVWDAIDRNRFFSGPDGSSGKTRDGTARAEPSQHVC